MTIPLIDWLATSPPRRSYALGALGLIGNVVSGTFVYEITKDTHLIWAQFFHTYSFYGLCAICAAIGRLTIHGSGIDGQSAEDSYAYHYVRASCLDAYAAECQKLIKQGRLGDFHSALDRLHQKP
jgi:hypothetical protein